MGVIEGMNNIISTIKLKSRLIFKRMGQAALQLVSVKERKFSRIWPLIDTIEGHLVSPLQERWLFCAAFSLPLGANIVEIGSYKGRSTCCLAFGCKGTNKHVFAIDTFDGNDDDFFERNFFSDFKENIERCGLSEYITPLIGRSDEVTRSWDKPINFLLIDGSHVYEDVLTDFHNYFHWVVPGGIVALHDVGDGQGWPGPFRAWHEDIKSRLINVGTCSTLAFGTKPK